MVSWSAFKTYLSGLRGSVQIRQNPDGTVSYEAVLIDEGAYLTFRFSPNKATITDRIFKYGLSESEVQTVLQVTVLSPPLTSIV